MWKPIVAGKGSAHTADDNARRSAAAYGQSGGTSRWRRGRGAPRSGGPVAGVEHQAVPLLDVQHRAPPRSPWSRRLAATPGKAVRSRVTKNMCPPLPGRQSLTTASAPLQKCVPVIQLRCPWGHLMFSPIMPHPRRICKVSLCRWVGNVIITSFMRPWRNWYTR